jgi:hypothetical protein
VSEDICLIHGTPMRYDVKSGLELCSLCEARSTSPVTLEIVNAMLEDCWRKTGSLNALKIRDHLNASLAKQANSAGPGESVTRPTPASPESQK